MSATDQVKATNIHWHEGDLSRDDRWGALKATGATVWFTGLSGSGKSTIASAVEQVLVNKGINSYRLDGDNVRHGLNKNLGFSAEDRTENIRRIGEVAKLFADAGVLSLTSFISPYKSDRDLCRKMHDESGLHFIEVFVDTPLEECEKRDPKGLYQKADAGELKNFTGVDSPYEAPEAADIAVDTTLGEPEEHAERIVELLKEKGIID